MSRLPTPNLIGSVGFQPRQVQAVVEPVSPFSDAVIGTLRAAAGVAQGIGVAQEATRKRTFREESERNREDSKAHSDLVKGWLDQTGAESLDAMSADEIRTLRDNLHTEYTAFQQGDHNSETQRQNALVWRQIDDRLFQYRERKDQATDEELDETTLEINSLLGTGHNSFFDFDDKRALEIFNDDDRIGAHASIAADQQAALAEFLLNKGWEQGDIDSYLESDQGQSLVSNLATRGMNKMAQTITTKRSHETRAEQQAVLNTMLPHLTGSGQGVAIAAIAEVYKGTDPQYFEDDITQAFELVARTVYDETQVMGALRAARELATNGGLGLSNEARIKIHESIPKLANQFVGIVTDQTIEAEVAASQASGNSLMLIDAPTGNAPNSLAEPVIQAFVNAGVLDVPADRNTWEAWDAVNAGEVEKGVLDSIKTLTTARIRAMGFKNGAGTRSRPTDDATAIGTAMTATEAGRLTGYVDTYFNPSATRDQLVEANSYFNSLEQSLQSLTAPGNRDVLTEAKADLAELGVTLNALADPDFRTDLLEDPERALRTQIALDRLNYGAAIVNSPNAASSVLAPILVNALTGPNGVTRALVVMSDFPTTGEAALSLAIDKAVKDQDLMPDAQASLRLRTARLIALGMYDTGGRNPADVIATLSQEVSAEEIAQVQEAIKETQGKYGGFLGFFKKEFDTTGLPAPVRDALELDLAVLLNRGEELKKQTVRAAMARHQAMNPMARAADGSLMVIDQAETANHVGKFDDTGEEVANRLTKLWTTADPFYIARETQTANRNPVMRVLGSINPAFLSAIPPTGQGLVLAGQYARTSAHQRAMTEARKMNPEDNPFYQFRDFTPFNVRLYNKRYREVMTEEYEASGSPMTVGMAAYQEAVGLTFDFREIKMARPDKGLTFVDIAWHQFREDQGEFYEELPEVVSPEFVRVVPHATPEGGDEIAIYFSREDGLPINESPYVVPDANGNPARFSFEALSTGRVEWGEAADNISEAAQTEISKLYFQANNKRH